MTAEVDVTMKRPRQRYWMISAGVLLLAAGLLLAQTFHAATVAQGRPILPDYGSLPEFSLTTHQGSAFHREHLSGSIWIASFIFTRCAGQCPMMNAQMAKLQEAFRRLPTVRFVSFTVDPEHDTPDVLADYAKRYGADAAHWQFVTGEPAAMTQLAERGFHLGVSRDGSAREPITHSLRFVLVDQAGHLRGYYDATEPPALKRLIADARSLVQDGPRVGGSESPCASPSCPPSTRS